MKIIYPQQNGVIAITFELPGWDMHELARMTTPNGVPYLIVEDSDLPADWSTSAAWEADFSQPHGAGIGPHRWHIQQSQAALQALAALTPPAAPAIILPQPMLPDDDLYALTAELIPQIPEELEGDELEKAEQQQIAVKMLIKEQHQAQLGARNEEIALLNQHRQAEHQQLLTMWEDETAQEAARLNGIIAQMQEELAKIEGAQA